MTIPARGQRSMFLNQIPGLDTLQTPFRGILEISASTGSIAVVGVRARFNERGDFLIAGTPPIEEETEESGRRLFCHLVDGGGYATQQILMSPGPHGHTAGAVRFFDQSGKPWSLTLR